VRWVTILAVALALLAAGCGGGDEESAATTDETSIEETATEDTTTEETTTSDETTTDTTDLSDVLADEDCLALAGVGATIAAAFAGTGADTDATAELEELADKVPAEIKADVQTLAAAFGEYADKLQEIGVEAGATPTAEQLQQLQAAISSLNQEELTAASNRIEAWATENCEAAG
jgi:ABC-type glycerol-3-phosphate transport system substrate-binding protein